MSRLPGQPRYLLVLVCCVYFSVLRSSVAAAAIHTGSVSLILPANGTAGAIRNVEASLSNSSADPIWPLSSLAPLSNPPPANITALVTSPVGAPKVSCNGALYGRNLNRDSCEQVYNLMSMDPSKVTFGERHEGFWQANLPFRWLSHDGRCAIDLGHTKGAISDEMAPGDIRRMVRVLLDVCVRGRPNEGGMVSNIGESGNLLLRIVPYKPTVTCGAEESAPPWITCRDIIDGMPTGGKKVTFGPRSDPETTVALPWAMTAGSRRCVVSIDGTEAGAVKDTWTWYSIWLAANAVDYMCIHLGKIGVAVNLGEFCLLAEAAPGGGDGIECARIGRKS